MNYYELGQIIGIIAVLPTLLMYIWKKKSSILIVQFVSNIMFILQYVFMGYGFVAWISGIVTVRGIVFYLKEFKPWAKHKFWLYFFMVLIILCGLLQWEGIRSLLPIFGSIIYTIAIWSDNTKKLRIMTIPSCICWLIYGALIGATGEIIVECMCLVSITAGIIKHDIKYERCPDGNRVNNQ